MAKLKPQETSVETVFTSTRPVNYLSSPYTHFKSEFRMYWGSQMRAISGSMMWVAHGCLGDHCMLGMDACIAYTPVF